MYSVPVTLLSILKDLSKHLLYLMTFLRDRSINSNPTSTWRQSSAPGYSRKSELDKSLTAEPLLPPKLHWVSSKVPSYLWCDLPAKIQEERNCYWTVLGFAVNTLRVLCACGLMAFLEFIGREHSLEESTLARPCEIHEAFLGCVAHAAPIAAIEPWAMFCPGERKGSKSIYQKRPV